MNGALPHAVKSVSAATLLCAVPGAGGDATSPQPRTEEFLWMSVATWQAKHAEHVAIAERGAVDLLFVGDSITEGWDAALWEKHFGRHRPANFGIGGDTSENVLWRLENGAIGKLRPKLVVLLVGTNNLGRLQQTPAEVARGIGAVVHKLHPAFPRARILVLGMFPCDASPDAPVRAKIREVNAAVATLDDGTSTFVRDLGSVFLEPDGRLTEQVSPDFLHLSPEGYRRWAEALVPIITPWLS